MKYLTLLSVLLTVIFGVLSQIGYIDWSYVWVLSPLWIVAIIGALFYGGLISFAVLMLKIAERKRKCKYTDFLKSIDENKNS